MAFQKEKITDEVFTIVTSMFEFLENKHINLLRERAHAFDKEHSYGCTLN